MNNNNEMISLFAAMNSQRNRIQSTLCVIRFIRQLKEHDFTEFRMQTHQSTVYKH